MEPSAEAVDSCHMQNENCSDMEQSAEDVYSCDTKNEQCSDMEHSAEDVDSYRMKHESDKEWFMRRAFLQAHHGKFSDSRLCCLAWCYINVECYGCSYPPALMSQLAELTAELPKTMDFVSTGTADNGSNSELSRSTALEPSVSRETNPQSSDDEPSDVESPCPATLSELEENFHYLAQTLKEVYRFKSPTELKNPTVLVKAAVDKAAMYATTPITELGRGKGFRCDLLIDDVLVASVEAQNKRLAKLNAHVAAAELLRKPHLQVSEDPEVGVSSRRLVSNDPPDAEKSLPWQLSANHMNTDKDATHSADRSSVQTENKRSQGDSFLRALLGDSAFEEESVTDSSAASIVQQSADFNKVASDNKTDSDVRFVSEEKLPENSKLPVVEDRADKTLDNSTDAATLEDTSPLLKLVNRLHGLACRVKSASKSSEQVNDGMGLIQKSLGGLRSSCHFVTVPGIGCCCLLFVDGVELASGKDSDKEQAKLAAHNAAVKLLQMPYLRLQDDPENQSFKLIGSMQPFQTVSTGDLPHEGQLVQKESTGHGDIDNWFRRTQEFVLGARNKRDAESSARR